MIDRAHERTWLLGALSALTLGLGLALVIWRRAPIASPVVIAPLTATFVGSVVLLRVRRDDLGAEGRFVDLWTIPHFVIGALFGLLGIDLAWTTALLVWWELVEVACRVDEYPTNRVTDVVISIVGWAVAQWAWAGAWPIA